MFAEVYFYRYQNILSFQFIRHYGNLDIVRDQRLFKCRNIWKVTTFTIRNVIRILESVGSTLVKLAHNSVQERRMALYFGLFLPSQLKCTF